MYYYRLSHFIFVEICLRCVYLPCRSTVQVRLILMLGGSGGDLEAMFAMRRESHALGIALVQESLDLFLQERLSNPELIV